MRRFPSRRAGLSLIAGIAVVVVAAVLMLTGPAPHRHPRAPLVTTGTLSTPTTTTTQSASPSTTVSTKSRAPATLAPARPAPSSQQFGASVNVLFIGGGSTPQQIASQLQRLSASGATLARSDALWEATEPTAPVKGTHRYDWTFDDTIAGAMAAHHLQWLPILDYSAPWAQSIPGQDHSPPSSAADYAAYAGAFAARYGTGGSFWSEHPSLPAEPIQTYEIWNEPDNAEFWTPTPDAARYADLYLAARGAIDAADPSARVIVGGLTTPSTFVPAMVAARPQLRGHVDGIAIHPYGTPSVVLTKLRDDRATLVSLGTGIATVPLYVTEFGWTTSPPGALDYVLAARRPSYIYGTLAFLGHTNCGVAMTVLYTWFTPRQNPADSQQFYGIDGPTGAPTADTRAFAHGLRRAAGPATVISLCL